jgi:predicted RNA-binding protein with PUA-like domain
MKKGDLVLFYHSNANPPGVMGVAKVDKEAYPDATAWDKRSKYYDEKSTREKPRWFMVDVRFVETFKRLVSLDEMKEAKGLEDMVVIKRGRLSVQPVKQREFDIVRRMGGMK